MLEPGENALALSLSGRVHPEVSAGTGYPTVAPTIAPGSATLTVRSYDCGPIANVPFTIGRELVEKSGGHDHTNSPNLDRIASLPTYGGSTDSDGVWTTTLTAGEIGATLKLTAATESLLGQPFSKSIEVSVGFAGLVDPGVSGPIRYTGSKSRHLANHFASPELHDMVRVMAEYYNALADSADQGSLGINDMSLRRGGLFDISGNWVPSHYRHRFGTDSDVDRRVLTSGGTYEFLDTDVLRSVVEDDLDGIFILESGGRMHVQVPEYRVGEILLRGTI